MERWRRLLRHDWSLRAMALIIALVLWVLAAGQPFSAPSVFPSFAESGDAGSTGGSGGAIEQQSFPVYVALLSTAGERVQVGAVQPAQIQATGAVTDLQQIDMLVARWRPAAGETSADVAVVPLDRHGRIVAGIRLTPAAVHVSAKVEAQK
ncbi:MAG TPA: hypothetical protein VFK80_10150 [Limnochordia bacterium]|nr:hypothetical protein [Limnochordia bacterium]